MQEAKAELAKQVAHLSYTQIKHRAQLQEALSSPEVGWNEFQEIVRDYISVLFELKRLQDKLSHLEDTVPATAKPKH